MTCNYSKRQLENGPVSTSCTVITFLTAELLPKLEVLGFKCCRLYLPGAPGSWDLRYPLPKTEKSADLAHYFSGVAKFCNFLYKIRKHRT